MSKLVAFFVIFSLNLSLYSCLRRFYRGREFYSNKHNIQTAAPSPFPDLWYEQRLDHFNEGETATWNQVSHKFKYINKSLKKKLIVILKLSR
jgi:hypothetical protein